MKYEIKPAQPPEFKPIAITITLENMAELKSMRARMVLPNSFSGDLPEGAGAYMVTDPLCGELNAILLARSAHNA